MAIKKAKMKICFFGDAAAHHLRRWAKYFTNKGHEVHVITFNSSILDNYGEVKVHIVKKWIPSSMLAARILSVIPMIIKLKTLLKNIAPDIIHAHSACGYAWMAMLSGFHPFVVTPWGGDVLIDIRNSKIEKFFTTLALKKADLITCDGENTKETMINLGIFSGKIKFITFGVDIQKFKPSLNNGNFRKQLFPSNSKIVISTRFLTPIHDVEAFIKAIPAVLQEALNVKFVIIGNGPQMGHLMNLAKSLGIFNAIKFAGTVSEEEISLYLRSADIYVSTSLSESGLAGSTAEAMACELPVINTDTGDIGLWIKDGKGGFIIPTKNPEILAGKIIYLLKHENERMKFGKINRKIIEEKNNYYKEMAKMENIYKELISNKYDR